MPRIRETFDISDLFKVAIDGHYLRRQEIVEVSHGRANRLSFHRGSNLVHFYSYSTRIAVVNIEENTMYITGFRYSNTTARHKRILRDGAEQYGLRYIEMPTEYVPPSYPELIKYASGRWASRKHYFNGVIPAKIHEVRRILFDEANFFTHLFREEMEKLVGLYNSMGKELKAEIWRYGLYMHTDLRKKSHQDDFMYFVSMFYAAFNYLFTHEDPFIASTEAVRNATIHYNKTTAFTINDLASALLQLHKPLALSSTQAA